MSETIRAVDLFCGAGGLSWGLVEALKAVAVDAEQPTEEVLTEYIDLVGVNHCEVAIETHERNHPWARHFHDDVQDVDPEEVFPGDDPDVRVVSGGIECTHWSTARGGVPVNEQKRMPAWDFVEWVDALEPECVLVENVPEFENWGPVENGEATRNGEIFPEWIDALHQAGPGYSVEWDTLTAANYGDATSRERLFILATREGRPEFPEPTHTEDGRGDTDQWRTAAEIIDWSEPGGSIWTRDLDDGRKTPPKNTTMQRIAEGIRRHCDDRLAAFADVLEQVGNGREDDPVPYRVQDLRERVVPAQYAGVVARAVEEPFLAALGPQVGLVDGPLVMGQQSNYLPWDAHERPLPTITTGGKVQRIDPTAFCLRQQSGGVPVPPSDPLPTISRRGAIGKVEVRRPLVKPRNGICGDKYSNSLYPPAARPLHVVTAKNHDGHLVTPSLVKYYGTSPPQSVADPLDTVTAGGWKYALSSPRLCPFLDDFEGPAASVDEPLGTLTTRDRFALVVPELYPWGLDVRYRMLQPRELAAAQGFPPDYEFAGTKTETTEQIGNAVPVNLAQSLVETLVLSDAPTLFDFGPGTSGTDVSTQGGRSA